MGFELLRPGWLALLLLVPFVLAVGGLGLRRRWRDLARVVVPSRLHRFAPGFSRARARLRLVFAGATLLFLGLAASGPVRGFTMREVSTRSIDLVAAIDTSNSMLARDLRPSRLERAKREVRSLLDALHGDRVALIAFSGDARDVAPLTHDRATLEGLLDFVSPEDNRRGGTNLAAALEKGLALFDGRTGAHEAIVLLTDGEDLEGKGAEVAKEAAERGIRVFVVGIGTEAGGKIPIRDARGAESFLKGPDGEDVVTKLDGRTLRELAEGTGGAYLSTENSPTPLVDLYRARISRLEGRDVEGGRRRVPHDRYQWPLVLAVICMGLEVGLRERVAGRANR
ncbi:MAG TPA: VWA domain-containing protein [Planctomycetes bacterium]|nr:VWA domain-containing protein [Planctomycetota bacterium]